jgi:4-hydroxybenzoate polyprenyltransferase
MKDKLLGLLKLTRLNENIPISTTLTVLGLIPLIGVVNFYTERVMFLLVANVIIVSAAFVLNDIGDSKVDKADSNKMNRNQISKGVLSRKEGYGLVYVMVALSMFMYIQINILTTVLGVMVLLAGYFYSSNSYRYRIKPPFDMILHSFGSLITLTAFTAFKYTGTSLILPMLIAFINSFVVQFNNQIRDYMIDRQKHVTTSVSVVGLEKSKNIRYLLSIFNIVLFTVYVIVYFNVITDYLYILVPLTVFVAVLYVSKYRYLLKDLV